MKGFGSLRKRKYVIFILIIFLFFSVKANANDIMSLNEIKSGMEGTGYTVFQGTKVEAFPVDIISIMENQGINQDLILVRTGGKKMKEVGGIAAGMSGSPVYVDGKVIGAIAYSWSDGSGLYALVTPIERMLNLFAKDSSENIEKLSGNQQSSFDLGENITKVNAPLMVSGMNGRALDRLKNDMSNYGVRVMQGGDAKAENISSGRIKPGSAVAVQLVKGDINISSIGTITYIDQNKILAFGHSFTNRGEVNYLLNEAYINATIPNNKQPFKLGSPIDRPLGIVNVDRSAGIAGEMKEFPEIIPFKIKVTDSSRGISNLVELQIIKDEKLLTSLAVNSALQSIDGVIDRLGKGTAKVDLSVMGSGLPDFEVERQNLFYSKSDIAGRSLYDFYRLLELITTNPFKKVDIMSINLEVDVSKKEQIAFLKEVKVLNENIYPGDKLEIEVTIQPYRKKSFTKIISFKLPDDMKAGMSNIVISGGFTGESYRPSAYNEQNFGSENGEIKENSIQGYENLDEMVSAYLETPKNNEIIVQVYPGYPSSMPPQEDASSEKEAPYENGNEEGEEVPEDEKEETTPKEENMNNQAGYEAEIKELFETNYILEGSLNLNVEVKNEKEIEIINEKQKKKNKSEE
mgnify:CR=1 FL=1